MLFCILVSGGVYILDMGADVCVVCLNVISMTGVFGNFRWETCPRVLLWHSMQEKPAGH